MVCGKKRLSGSNLLLAAMIVSVIAGSCIGVGIRASGLEFSKRELIYLNFPGDAFLRMLKMLILPLIVSSLVNSLAQLQLQTAGRLGYITAIYFFLTTLLAAIEGIIAVLAIRPGDHAGGVNLVGGGKPPAESECKNYPVDTVLDLIRNLFPENMIQTCFSSVRSCSKQINVTVTNQTLLDMNETENAVVTVEEEHIALIDVAGINILGIVMLAIAFGAVISSLGEDGRPLRDFFKSLEQATMKLVTIVIWQVYRMLKINFFSDYQHGYGPIGITFLIAAQIVEMKDPKREVESVGFYLLTVILCLVIHGFIVLPLIYFIFVRKNPLPHIRGTFKAMVTAVGTDSSSATLPITIECCESNCGIDTLVARFVCPLGATVNMNGSALYEAIAAIFIAQVIGRPLGIGQIILVSLTATLAAVGAAGIPQAGLVTLLMVLTAADLPVEYAALIIPVDWFLDRIRTVVNIFGDTVGAAIVQKLCASDLERMKHAHVVQSVLANGVGNEATKLPLKNQVVPIEAIKMPRRFSRSTSDEGTAF